MRNSGSEYLAQIAQTALIVALAIVAIALSVQDPLFGPVWFASIVVWIACFHIAKESYRG